MLRVSLKAFRADPIGTLRNIAGVGDVVAFSMARRYFVLLNHPDHIVRVLMGSDDDFSRGPGLLRTRPILGDGLLTNDDATVHRERRRAFQPGFGRGKIEAYLPTMTAEAEAITSHWMSGRIVDMHREMNRLTLGIAGRTLFDSDAVDDDLATDVYDAVRSGVDVLYRRLAPQAGSGKTSRDRQTAAAIDTLDAGLAHIRGRSLGGGITEALASLEHRASRDEAMTFLLGGHESVANALTWTCYLLARHQGVQDRAALAVQDGEIAYLRAVVQESMRLYPPAWMLSRSARRPMTFGEVSMPDGGIVVAAQCVTHVDARWFRDPHSFRPDRWIDSAAPPRFAYFPFGAGLRSCIGERFAMAELPAVLAVILGRWRLLRASADPVECLPAVTLRPRGGVFIGLERK